MPEPEKRPRGRPPGVKRKHKVYTYLDGDEKRLFDRLQKRRREAMAAVLRKAIFLLAEQEGMSVDDTD